MEQEEGLTIPDDGKLDYEALEDRNKVAKEIEALGINDEKFEDIDREFDLFIKEIIGNTNLERFRREYEQIFQTLQTFYEGEKRLIKRCKDLNNNIYEKATNVKAAIRMASNEVEKISSLKQKVQKSYEEVANQREKEEKAREKITRLKADIAALKRKTLEETDLEED